MKRIKLVGLDFHAETNSAAVAAGCHERAGGLQGQEYCFA
jgi:hypothetical protein